MIGKIPKIMSVKTFTKRKPYRIWSAKLYNQESMKSTKKLENIFVIEYREVLLLHYLNLTIEENNENYV